VNADGTDFRCGQEPSAPRSRFVLARYFTATIMHSVDLMKPWATRNVAMQ
jgi:hypothetical protein